MITWLIYAALLHARLLKGWHGRRIAWLAVLGFLAVIFTYLRRQLPAKHARLHDLTTVFLHLGQKKGHGHRAPYQSRVKLNRRQGVPRLRQWYIDPACCRPSERLPTSAKLVYLDGTLVGSQSKSSEVASRPHLLQTYLMSSSLPLQ